MDVGLRKGPCISFRVSSMYYHVVCNLPIYKICALCSIFSAISMLLTTENSGDLEIRVPDGSWSLKVTYTSEFFTCHFLLVLTVSEAVSCTVYEIYPLIGPPSATPLAFNAPTEEFAGDNLRKICVEVRRWPRYAAVKKYCDSRL